MCVFLLEQHTFIIINVCEKVLVTMVRKWRYGYLDVLNISWKLQSGSFEISTSIDHAKTL